jgi:hypothetical protein
MTIRGVNQGLLPMTISDEEESNSFSGCQLLNCDEGHAMINHRHIQ